MRKLAVLISVMLIPMGLSAQEPNSERIKLVKQEGGSSHSVTLSKEQQIERYTFLLESLDKKEAAIRSNPETLAQAEASGWFVKADNTRKMVREKLAELQTK